MATRGKEVRQNRRTKRRGGSRRQQPVKDAVTFGRRRGGKRIYIKKGEFKRNFRGFEPRRTRCQLDRATACPARARSGPPSRGKRLRTSCHWKWGLTACSSCGAASRKGPVSKARRQSPPGSRPRRKGWLLASKPPAATAWEFSVCDWASH